MSEPPILGTTSGLLIGVGRSTVLAVDHVLEALPAALSAVDSVLLRALDAGIGSVVMTYGVARRWKDRLPAPPIVRVDGNETALRGDWLSSANWRMFFDPGLLTDIGYHRFACNLVLGGPAELESVMVVSAVIAAAHRAGGSVLVSAMSLVSDDDLSYRFSTQPESCAYAARMAEELGADAVNVYSRGEAENLLAARSVTTISLLAANPPDGSDRAASWAYAAGRAGYAGMCLGSSLWGARDLARATDMFESSFLAGIADHGNTRTGASP